MRRGVSIDQWRQNREPGWHKDIGYALQDVLRSHRYYSGKGSKPDDPGWHTCACRAWEGYWSGFEPHVTDHIRAVIVQRDSEASHDQR